MEIEKKYLVKEIPSTLDTFELWEIEQCYLCNEPTLRIRKKNDSYILTYKNRGEYEQQVSDKSLSVCQEIEVPLTKAAYYHLKEKADGICICKSRYRIPFGKYTIELDVFHGEWEGLLLAEVEFETVEEAKKFTPPSWFGEDVSGDYHYRNSYLSTKENEK